MIINALSRTEYISSNIFLKVFEWSLTLMTYQLFFQSIHYILLYDCETAGELNAQNKNKQ